ncbi:SWI/SNF- matrix-associated actin-dependent regulator of chromatin sub A member 5 [Branchiostoma belcheri]|nr:SWI/SNF- matrix-associated actin-dependent regulator of chromatin sub A member 5 [Branchiostoma belcheri]
MSMYISLALFSLLVVLGATQRTSSHEDRPLVPEIPLHIRQLLRNVTSYEELKTTFNLDIFSAADDRFSLTGPPPCIPREVPVPVPVDAEPNVVLWPSCVSVARCGGCCNSDLYECQATRSSSQVSSILKLFYAPGNPNSQPFNTAFDQVHVERHDECACVCKNKRLCDLRTHFFDDNTCECVCRVRGGCSVSAVSDNFCNRQCSAGFRLDEDSCRCRPDGGALFGGLGRRRRRTEP